MVTLRALRAVRFESGSPTSSTCPSLWLRSPTKAEAPDSDSGGWRFESARGHFSFEGPQILGYRLLTAWIQVRVLFAPFPWGR